METALTGRLFRRRWKAISCISPVPNRSAISSANQAAHNVASGSSGGKSVIHDSSSKAQPRGDGTRLFLTAAASGRAAEENREHDADGVEKEGDQSDDIPSPLLANVQHLFHMVLLQRGRRHRNGLMKRLVDTYEKKAESSTNLATSTNG
jgi:hypothetical protein